MRRGLVASREQARAAIAANRVLVAGALADKPARMVDPGEPVSLVGPAPRFVSRGGEKLDAALDRFQVDVTGKRALDAGASTGGFTDCLLQRGARSVVAVDVGYGQLHPSLRGDRRVDVRERTNVRLLDAAMIGGAVPVIVADLSFISLAAVTPALLSCATDDADLVLLVKPQFEAGRAAASRGRGVIREPAVWREVLLGLHRAWRVQGAAMIDLMASPLRGAEGNVEFLARLRPGADAPAGDELVDRVLADVEA